jgi:hypothetical protein
MRAIRVGRDIHELLSTASYTMASRTQNTIGRTWDARDVQSQLNAIIVIPSRCSLSRPLITMDYILERIYHYSPPSHTRTRPLEVICIGPSRSGTESLRAALLDIGFQNVYHGWEALKPTNEADFELHSQLLRKKYRSGDRSGNVRLTAEDFDSFLARYDGLTDMDGALFAADLLEAYPEAKIIMNYRKDLNAWHKSFVETFGVLGSSWMFWFMSHFEAQLYWSRRYIFREMSKYLKGYLFKHQFADLFAHDQSPFISVAAWPRTVYGHTVNTWQWCVVQLLQKGYWSGRSRMAMSHYANSLTRKFQRRNFQREICQLNLLEQCKLDRKYT